MRIKLSCQLLRYNLRLINPPSGLTGDYKMNTTNTKKELLAEISRLRRYAELLLSAKSNKQYSLDTANEEIAELKIQVTKQHAAAVYFAKSYVKTLPSITISS